MSSTVRLGRKTYVKLLWVLAHDLKELLEESPDDHLDGWRVSSSSWSGVLLLGNISIGCGHCEVVKVRRTLWSTSCIKQYQLR